MSLLFKRAGAALILLFGPVITFLTGLAASHPMIAIVAVIVYETFILVLGVVLSALADLRTRWTSRIADSIDGKIQRTISPYRRACMKYILASHSHVDLRGLTTRGEYSLDVESVYVQLSLESNSLHELSSSLLDYAMVQLRRLKTLRSSSSNSPANWIEKTKLGLLTSLLIKTMALRIVALLATIFEHRESRTSPHLDQVDNRTIWHWLSNATTYDSILAIIGPPGSGKTTLLKHACIAILKRSAPARRQRVLSRKIPLLIALRDHKENFSETTGKPPPLAEIIRETLKDMQKTEPPRWVETQLEHGRFLIMLDGLDEIPADSSRVRISEWVEIQRQAYPDVSFIVTSRPFGYRSAPLNSATVVQVQPFTNAQVRTFVQSWYTLTSVRSFGGLTDAALLHARRSATDLLEKLAQSSNLLRLTVNPLLLTMIANVHHYRGALPGSRIELYREICEVLLGKRHQARGIELKMSAIQKQAVLQDLAFHMMDTGVRDITPVAAETVISDILQRVGSSLTVSQFLVHVEESSGLLIEREHQTYTFAHFTFQEYLAAAYIREHQMLDLLLNNIDSPWWRETILLYAAQSDATQIVERCLRDVRNFGLLHLATLCSEEGREVSLQARNALTRFMESDVRDMPENRRAVGAISLFRRVRSFSSSTDDEYVDRSLINCIEYQLFLDKDMGYGAGTPDHWNSAVYSPNWETRPVVGVRLEDVPLFLRWLQKFLDDEWIYLVPTRPNVDMTLMCSSIQPGCLSAIPALTKRSSQARHPHDAQEPQRMTLEWASPKRFELPPEVLLDQINEDKKIADELISMSTATLTADAGSYVLEDAGLDLGATLRSDLLEGLMKDDSSHRLALLEHLSYIRNVDLGVAMRIAESLNQRVLTQRDYLFLKPDEASALTRLCQTLSQCMAIAFNRASKPSYRFSGNSKERFYARLCALAAADICNKERARSENDPLVSRRPMVRLLEMVSRSRPIRPIVRLLYRRLPEPFLLPRADIFQYLVHDLHFIFVTLTLHEARAAGRLPAWEGIVLARRRKIDSNAALSLVTE